MKHLIIIAALIASQASAERFGAGLDVHSVGGWGQQADSYTPSNPSPGRGGTYDGDDADNGLFGQREPVSDPFRYSKPQPLRGWGKSIFWRWGK